MRLGIITAVAWRRCWRFRRVPVRCSSMMAGASWIGWFGPSPSGFIVYDGRGNIVSAVRQTGFDRPLLVDSRTSGIRVIGTGLSSGEVSGLRGGVGFE